MASADNTPGTDTAELQSVLTRYIDSCDGYAAAAKAVESPGLAAAFLEIAERRKLIVDRVATLIQNQGKKPDVGGSIEGAVHRTWIQFRAKMTEEEFKVTMAECVRGEKELDRTIHEALDSGLLEPDHAAILKEVSTELEQALVTFNSALVKP